MTKDQKALIKATIPILEEQGVLLTTHFYNRMFTYNPELKNMFNMGNQRNGKQQTALAMAVLAYADHIDNPSVLHPVINSIGHKHTSLDVRPEHYHIVGTHLVASIAEVLGNDATPEVIDAWTVAYDQLAALMSGHESSLYREQVQKNGGWTGWRPFIVKDKIKESEEITSFYLYPADGGRVADFIPGQYISIRMFLPELNLMQPRQYSISSTPNGEYYRISVKQEKGTTHPSGIISNMLHQKIKPGDKIEVSAPAGTFVLDSDKNRPLCFVSAGVGLTPLMAMLETALKDSPGQKKIWIHGCKSSEAHAFKRRLAEWNNKYEELDCHIFYDGVAPPIAAMRQYRGWVDLGLLADILRQDAHYYLCGPAPFIQKHFDFLTDQGIPKEAIRFEEFGPATHQVS